MSKQSKKKRKNNSIKVDKKKQIKKMPLAIGITACLLCAAAIVFLIINTVMQSSVKSQFCNYSWISSSATNASGDEVDMGVIYDTNYSSYQGTLNFKDDGTFTMWLTPGDPSDGTHDGKYTINSDNSLSVTFTDGTESSFSVERSGGEVTAIIVDYSDYVVRFTKQ